MINEFYLEIKSSTCKQRSKSEEKIFLNLRNKFGLNLHDMNKTNQSLERLKVSKAFSTKYFTSNLFKVRKLSIFELLKEKSDKKKFQTNLIKNISKKPLNKERKGSEI